jgi:hypothetical protein
LGKFRVTVAATGTVLMVLCAAAAFAASVCFFRYVPGAVESRARDALLFAALTVIFVFLAARTWMRRLHATMLEAVTALLGVELIVYSVIASANGMTTFDGFYAMFWASILFAPWWLGACWFEALERPASSEEAKLRERATS